MAGLPRAALLAWCVVPLALTTASTCGLKGTDNTAWSRIVNGQEASSGEWKWQACLKTPGQRQCWCGGTLISETWVLSAAHCVQSDGVVSAPSSFEIMLGDHNHFQSGESQADEQEIAVKTVIPHPSYDENSMAYDYALVELATPAVMSNHVGTACLPTASMELNGGETCYISGWGTLSEGGQQPDNIQEAEVTIVGSSVCGTKYGGGIDATSMLCAQGHRNGQIVDACQGDSGGPLVCETGGLWYVHGATSWGYGCAAAQYPGIWARVTAELGWINSYVNANPTPSPPTPPPTPAPTLDFDGKMFKVLSGACTVDDSSCAQSPNYPSDYDSDQSCDIAVSQGHALEPILVMDFDTEQDWDIMTVNGHEYSGSTGPAGVIPSANIIWSSDFMVNAGGWRLCPQYSHQLQPTVQPTPAPPTPEPTPVPPTPPPTPVQCGVPGPDSTPWSGARIVNGQAASACEWNWQVALKTSGFGESFCGGTLIDKGWVLTAAHCIGEASFSIIAGEFDLASDNDGAEPVILEVLNVIKHPQYDPYTYDMDFALVQLADDAPFGNCIGIACLPTAELPAGSTCYISGWGTLSSGGVTSDTIQEAEVTTLTNEDCEMKYDGTWSYDNWSNWSYDNWSSDNWSYYDDSNYTYYYWDYFESHDHITDNMLCAQGSMNGNIADACQGDSGGPLVCLNDTTGFYELHGATSWGYGCADPDYPGVWARVTSAMDWINETMTNPPPPPTPYPPFAEAWTVVSGDCEISGDCLTSPNYPQQYNIDEQCTILVAQGNTMALEVTAFQTEDYFDYLQVDGGVFYGGDGPDGVVPGSMITWSSDFTIAGQGWKICLVESEGGAGSCQDHVPAGEAVWYDSDGSTYTCEWYELTDSCLSYGQSYPNFDMTASEACCACGGGVSGGVVAATTAGPDASTTTAGLLGGASGTGNDADDRDTDAISAASYSPGGGVLLLACALLAAARAA